MNPAYVEIANEVLLTVAVLLGLGFGSLFWWFVLKD